MGFCPRAARAEADAFQQLGSPSTVVTCTVAGLGNPQLRMAAAVISIRFCIAEPPQSCGSRSLMDRYSMRSSRSRSSLCKTLLTTDLETPARRASSSCDNGDVLFDGRVQPRIHHLDETVHDVVVGIVQAKMLATFDELAEPGVQLVEQEPIEGNARIEQPLERSERHERNHTVDHRDRIERPGASLEKSAFSEPAT